MKNDACGNKYKWVLNDQQMIVYKCNINDYLELYFLLYKWLL